MNKKQRKARLKYLKQLQRGPDPKEIKRRKVLDLLLPKVASKFPVDCRSCRYQIAAVTKPRSPIQKMHCIILHSFPARNGQYDSFVIEPGDKPGCSSYQPLN